MDRSSPKTVLIYDGDCRFCTAVQRALRRWDRSRRVEFIPSQDPIVARRFPGLSFSGCTDAMHVVDADGRDWQGARAARELLRVLPWGTPLGWAFDLPGVPRLAARVYRWIAANRYAMGRTCPRRDR